MKPKEQRILPLPPEVSAQIRSGTIITSLNETIIELLKNSLDAGARRITLEVNHARGGCSVEDDGNGIAQTEFGEGGGLGRLYYTSKHNPSSFNYGQRGAFLASLASLCLLTITSHYQGQNTPSTMILHHSSPISRLIPSPDHHLLSLHTHGTRVTVHDLFGNMPVRVKQRGALFGNNEYLEKEWDDLKKRIIGLLLAWGQPVVLKIADKERKRRWTSGKGHADANVTDIVQTGLKNRHSSFDLNYTRYLLSRIGDTTPENSSWKSVSARTALVAIRGVISLDPCPTKRAQFLSFGNQAVESRSCKNVLYDEINQIFVLSSFGISDTNSGCYNGGAKAPREDGPNITEPINETLQLGVKGVDKWPKFYIRFDVKSTTSWNNTVSEHGDNFESETSVEKVLEVLRSMLFQFLKQHDLQPRARKRRRIREQVVPEELALPAKCRATELADTTSPEKTINELPVLLAAASQTRGFGGWSRIKGSKTEALEDLYSGLPRSKRKHFTNKDSGANEQGSNNTSTPSIQTERSHRIVRSSISGTPVDAFSVPSQLGHLEDQIVCSAGDDVISWTHPNTGNAVLINARTGLVVLPSDPIQKDIESATLSSRATSAIPSRDNTTRKGSLQNIRLDTALPKPDSWVGKLLQGWDNPVFRKAEETIPCVSLQDIDPSTAKAKGRCDHECSENETRLFERTFGASQVAYSGTLSKTGLKRAEVLGQVDQKFILVKVNVALGGDETGDVADALLVLVDQHAADERCRIESLLDALCRPEAGASRQFFQVQSAQLPAPIRFSVTAQEARLFHLHAKHFNSWGICYQLRNPSSRPSSCSWSSSASDNVLTVTRLPPTILERCRLEQSLLVDILRSEVWALDEKASTKVTLPANTKHDIAGDSDPGPRWVERIGQCPQKVVEMLNSRACRSSIMFNDVLSLDECKSLISRLAECAFPFQCAHGRPSMIPIANLGAFGTASGLMEARGGHDSRPEERPYAQAFDAWRATLAGEG